MSLAVGKINKAKARNETVRCIRRGYSSPLALVFP